MPTPQRTLLIADDSPTVRKVVSLTFTDEGFRVVAVSTGADALAEVAREVPDVVLADVHMPAPGGYELCARLKRDGRTSRLPVVLLVGAFEPFDEAEARSCGADEVLTKPFQSIRDLVNKVGGLLGAQPEPRPGAGDDAHGEHTATAASATTATTREEAIRTDAPAMRVAPAADSKSESHSQPVIDLTGDAPRSTFNHDTARTTADAHDYPDYDMDDANIETVPADSFAARAQPASAVETFAADAEETFSAPQASVAEPAPARSFAARAAAAAEADDTLLELGDIDSSPATRAAAADDDDFVLDFDGVGDAFAPQAFASSSQSPQIFQHATSFAEPSYAAPRHDEASDDEAGDDEASGDEASFYEDAPSAVEMQSAGSVSMAEPSAAWDAAQEFAVSPSAVTERVVSPNWQEPELRETTADDARVQSITDHEEAAAPHDADAHADAASSQLASSADAQLSPETVEAIARRVVELMSDQAVREIAWEVVPDLAERLIRQRLEEERARQ